MKYCYEVIFERCSLSKGLPKYIHTYSNIKPFPFSSSIFCFLLSLLELWGNWKQWKWKTETENGNNQNLMQMNARVTPLVNDYLLKTTSVQRPQNYVPKITDD